MLTQHKTKIYDSKVKINVDSRLEVKQPILPLLGRSGNMNSWQSKTLVEDIIEKNERKTVNKERKQLKMIKF